MVTWPIMALLLATPGAVQGAAAQAPEPMEEQGHYVWGCEARHERSGSVLTAKWSVEDGIAGTPIYQWQNTAPVEVDDYRFKSKIVLSGYWYPYDQDDAETAFRRGTLYMTWEAPRSIPKYMTLDLGGYRGSGDFTAGMRRDKGRSAIGSVRFDALLRWADDDPAVRMTILNEDRDKFFGGATIPVDTIRALRGDFDRIGEQIRARTQVHRSECERQEREEDAIII